MSVELKNSLKWSFLIWAIAGVIWGYSISIPGEIVGFMASDITLLVLLIVGGIIELAVRVMYKVDSKEEPPFYITLYKVAVGLAFSFIFAFPNVGILIILGIIVLLGLIAQFWKPMRNALKK